MKSEIHDHTSRWIQQLLSEGFTALKNNDTDYASACCKKIIQKKPNFPQAHFLVGLIALELGDRKTAIQAFGSVTTLDQRHGPAWAHLAYELVNSGQVVRAEDALNNAVKYESSNHHIQHLIGNLFSKLGDYKNAEIWQAKACIHLPYKLSYNVNHANSLLYMGKDKALTDKLDDIFQYAPENAQGHFILSTSRKAENYEHIDQLKSLLKEKESPTTSLEKIENSFLNYALGKELEDQEQWEEAFSAFSQGATSKRSTLLYPEQVQESAYIALEKHFTRQWLTEQTPGCQDDSPIFVLGQPRTGTTLIERIITSHSQVESAGELRQFSMALRRLLNYSEPEWFCEDFIAQSAKLDGKLIGDMYLHTSQKVRGNSPRFVDKMPPNFHYIPLILNALPNAKIVHVVRHPMDACFANYKQLFADAYPHSYDQREMARHHARYHKLMSIWRERFPNRFFDIAYEDITSDIEQHARRLIDYLDLPWEDACLNFYNRRSAVATASTVQVRTPAHTRSVGRWKKYQQHLTPMMDELKKANIDIT